jgi:hypothetical protein
MGALLGYGAPDSPTWEISGGDAAFDTDPAALNNGKVADRTSVKWPSGGQTTSTAVELKMYWGVEQPVRIIPIVGLKGGPGGATGIPVGTKIIVTGQRLSDSDSAGGTYPYSLGGNSTTRTVLLPNGDIGAWIVLPTTNTDLVGIQVKIFNDVNGVTSFLADQFIYPGEIDAFQGFAFDIKDGQLQAGYDGLPTLLHTVNNQPVAFPAEPFRTNGIQVIPLPRATSFGTSSSAVPSYEQLIGTLMKGGQSIAFIPSWDNGTGVLDTWMVHQTAIFGVPTPSGLGRPQSMGDNYFVSKFGITESPPGV